MTPAKLPSTLICGVVRNGGEAFVKTLKMIDDLKPHLTDWSVVIVTNDNTDQTDAVITAWAQRSHKHTLISLDGFATSWPDRIDRLAVARNYYLAHLRSLPPDQYQYVLIVDLDGPNQDVNPSEFVSVINSLKFDWDGVFANQLRGYYDLYPLRHDTWCPTDCWEEVRKATRSPFKSQRGRAARENFVYGRQYAIPASTPPFRVHSAFGGLGLYRAAALHNCWYGSRRPDGIKVCDHVVVNEEIDRRGGKLFIVPALLNEAPLEHLRPGSGKPIPSHLKL
jgi:hypothetical protein